MSGPWERPGAGGTRLVVDEELFGALRELLDSARREVAIATANLKNLHLPRGRRWVSILEVFAALVDRGVTIRLLAARDPSGPFAEALEGHVALFREGRFDLRICPRNHGKAVLVDGERLILASANLTGAGLGGKSATRRNFEAGILSDDPGIVGPLARHFESIWSGERCGGCGRREHCPVPIDEMLRS